jgi:hypothetical protein
VRELALSSEKRLLGAELEKLTNTQHTAYSSEAQGLIVCDPVVRLIYHQTAILTCNDRQNFTILKHGKGRLRREERDLAKASQLASKQSLL